MINRIGPMSNEKRKRKMDAIYARNAAQDRVAKGVKESNTLGYRFSDVAYEDGIKWFNSGLPLEDAPEKLRKDGSFIKGFKRGEFIKITNDAMYRKGQEDYIKGKTLEEIDDKYKNNEYFMSGYNSCKKTR